MNDLASSNIYTDFQGLAKLRHQARNNDPQAIRETAQQFEGLFIQMMLKSMRQTAQGEGLFDSDQVKFYQQMLDQQVSLDLSKGQGIGLAKVLYRQLGGESGEATSPKPLTQPYSPPARSYHRIESLPASKGIAAPDWKELPPREFVQHLWPHAVEAGDNLGVQPEVLIAQAALETGWGHHIVNNAGGESSHNLFGIKADRHWQGPQMSVRTLEYKDGVAMPSRAAFRAYGSIASSFGDYVSFLQGNPRYQTALEQTHDPGLFLRALQEAGYATDPKYAQKVRSIMSMDALQETVASLKHS